MCLLVLLRIYKTYYIRFYSCITDFSVMQNVFFVAFL